MFWLADFNFSQITCFLATQKSKVNKISFHLIMINEFSYVSFTIKYKRNLKGTLMQIWKSSFMFMFI